MLNRDGVVLQVIINPKVSHLDGSSSLATQFSSSCQRYCRLVVFPDMSWQLWISLRTLEPQHQWQRVRQSDKFGLRGALRMEFLHRGSTVEFALSKSNHHSSVTSHVWSDDYRWWTADDASTFAVILIRPVLPKLILKCLVFIRHFIPSVSL